jgi:hypothetical protein
MPLRVTLTVVEMNVGHVQMAECVLKTLIARAGDAETNGVKDQDVMIYYAMVMRLMKIVVEVVLRV